MNNLIQYRVRSSYLTYRRHIIINGKCCEIFFFRFCDIAYFCISETMIHECRFPHTSLLLAITNIYIRRISITQISGINTSVSIQFLGISHLYCISAFSTWNKSNPSRHVLSKVKNIFVFDFRHRYWIPIFIFYHTRCHLRTQFSVWYRCSVGIYPF